jgi:hypothetical protein
MLLNQAATVIRAKTGIQIPWAFWPPASAGVTLIQQH